MLDGGFILVHRSLLKWEWYDDISTTRLFLHLLLTVNYEPQKWQGMTIQRGQRVASLGVLATETGLSLQNVRTAISHLKSTGEITHEPHSKFGLFTVVHYDSYQSPNTLGNSQPTVSQQSANNNGININKANKAIKEKDIPNGISKKKTGEFANVLLTDQEQAKLNGCMGELGAAEYIERLSAYIAQTGRRYKSHYATLLSWWRKDGQPVKNAVRELATELDPDDPFGPSRIAEGG